MGYGLWVMGYGFYWKLTGTIRSSVRGTLHFREAWVREFFHVMVST